MTEGAERERVAQLGRLAETDPAALGEVFAADIPVEALAAIDR